MAEALVSIALEKLADIIGQQIALFAGAGDDLRGLQKTFQHLKAFLQDVESKEVTEESLRFWLFELRQVAYDIDDLLNECLENVVDGDAGNRACAAACLPSLSNCLNRIVSLYKLPQSIKETRKRLDDIARNKEQFNISQISSSSGHRTVKRSRTMTTSHMKEEMVGRDDDVKIVIYELVNGSCSGYDRHVQVTAIVGIGGLGKTTLARKISHDVKVRGHFEFCYWVCVTENFDLERITKAIIEQAEGRATQLSELESLQNELVKILKGKRFLLVLDDVWNDDKKKWNALQSCLTSGAPGSRILVTTRVQKVAENAVNIAYVHRLKGLSDDHSWMVFRSIALDWRTSEEYSRLESVGREIVIKCKGIPLLITVMGNVMNSKVTVEDWQNISDSKMWSLREVEKKISSALWLSYSNLPPHLKQCFVYSSIFPKDWELEKVVLVRLWVAQGFICSEGNRETEDIGAEYFEDLVAWSIFQQVHVGSKGKISFKMHDLYNDLAEFIAKEEIYTISSTGRKSEQCSSSSDSNIRHAFLSFIDTDDKSNHIPLAFHRAKKLRTLFLSSVYVNEHANVGFFHQERLLRAVVFMGSVHNGNIVKLPKNIGKMRHLRYLDLSYLMIEELPESVSDLRNLHTLSLNHCSFLRKLPTEIGRMVRLRHLEIEGTIRLRYLPEGLGRIVGLQSLSKFIVGMGRGECEIDELQRLNSLRGSLEVVNFNLFVISSQEEVEKAQLYNKQHIRRLVLDMRKDTVRMLKKKLTYPVGKSIDIIVEGLRPHGNLEELELVGYAGRKWPSWMEAMQCLRKLEVDFVYGLEMLPNTFPNLPSLREFKIRTLSDVILPDEGWEGMMALQKLEISRSFEVKSLPDGLIRLQSLEDLDISYCHKLESLPEGLGQLKQLKTLRIVGLGALTCLPGSLGQLESLENLEISSCEKLESLPHSLGQLEALNFLKIHECKALGSLPHGLRDLSLLRNLQIKNCPTLSERCKSKVGEDWPKIEHIPNICINGDWIQR